MLVHADLVMQIGGQGYGAEQAAKVQRKQQHKTHTSRALCARTLPPRAYLLVHASASAFSCLIRP